jgi:Tfp pilus assembly protein PilF
MIIKETADAHYNISKSYIEMKKYLKAALHLTKAISLNFHVYEYFKLRASLYKIMGYNELADDDEKFANSLISTKGKL